MPSFNKLIIVGHLGRDPELKYSGAGSAFCSFSVATSEKKRGRDGEQQEVTTWFRVTAFGKTAEFVNQYCAKGALVYVEGRLRMEEYTDKDGNKRHSLEVSADNVQSLASKGEQGQAETPAPRAATQAARQAQAPMKRNEPAWDDDEPPF